jgi:hypothetical protein
LTDPVPTGGGWELFALAQTVAVDAVTAEVTQALQQRGVPAIVLKGPGIAAWLYGTGANRTYRDTDLLIRAEDRRAAEETLREAGFEDALGPLAHPRMESDSSYPWRRGVTEVDLHTTIWGLGAPADQVWAELSRDPDTLVIADTEVRVPSVEGRALHVALHAAHHGDGSPKALDDLARAVATAPDRLWDAAASLAARLGASGAFATGLRLVPEGEAIARRLGLEHATSVEALLDASQVPLAWGFEELAATPGVAGKVKLLARELAPSPAFMRWWSPLARRGRMGLIAAYATRPLLLATRAVPGFRAWRRARARADSRGPSAPTGA